MGNKSKSKLGDKRLEKGYETLLGNMLIRYSVILRQLSDGRSEEVQLSRFVNNPKVSAKGLVDHTCQQLTVDVKDKSLLVIGDSSTLSFSSNARREELGYVGHNGNKSGFSVHPAIVLDAEHGACYGLGGISIHKAPFVRTAEQKSEQEQKRRDKWKTPFKEKERYKWFDAAQQAVSNYAQAARYTLIGDRESDIYALMGLTLNRGWDFVYRSQFNRVVTSQQGETTKLHELIQGWPVSHTYQLDLPKTKKRSAHQATIALKYGSVHIPRPEFSKDPELEDRLKVWVIQAHEQKQSVVGDEPPIHWLLLSSLPVESISQALQVIKWYLWRWTIEQLFRTLKSKGLNVEKAEVESFHGLVNLATLALITATQVMQLVQSRDGQTLQKIGDAFSVPEIRCLQALNKKLQGNTQKQKNPHPPDTLAFAAWIIARLGGWKGYTNNRPPGPITFINGLARFYGILEGFYLFDQQSY